MNKPKTFDPVYTALALAMGVPFNQVARQQKLSTQTLKKLIRDGWKAMPQFAVFAEQPGQMRIRTQPYNGSGQFDETRPSVIVPINQGDK